MCVKFQSAHTDTAVTILNQSKISCDIWLIWISDTGRVWRKFTFRDNACNTVFVLVDSNDYGWHEKKFHHEYTTVLITHPIMTWLQANGQQTLDVACNATSYWHGGASLLSFTWGFQEKYWIFSVIFSYAIMISSSRKFLPTLNGPNLNGIVRPAMVM